MVVYGYPEQSQGYFNALKSEFEQVHADELQSFQILTQKEHVLADPTAKLYRETRYRLPLNRVAYFNLITFLESNEDKGGKSVIYLLQAHFDIIPIARDPLNQYSFEAMINQARGIQDDPEIQVGIPGAFVGVTNKDMNNNDAPVRLGMMPMEADLATDVRAQLEEEDLRQPATEGKISLTEEFDRTIKREETPDGPNRTEIPFPPSRSRDIVMEVQKIKESRDRFKIEGRTGGIGPAVSVSMFTFHNTLDRLVAKALISLKKSNICSITCMEFSDDNNLVAVGTEESYIRIWNLHGEPISSALAADSNSPPSSSRRLIGHSAPVYSVSFSPSVDVPDADATTPSTAPKLLLSSSSDKTIRLWSLEAWSCLVVYKGHEGPVWNVRWGPFGHYFATCGWDKTVRVWGQDHISYLRMMIGHDTNVNQIAWHPNGAYIFSASDQADKTVRMWAFTTGECVRVLVGHTEFISAIECSPNGKILATADNGGSIILWDLAKGQQIKRCRGHGKGGIYSLSFSVESTVLVSGGADGTVRIWDVEVPTDPFKNADGEIIGAGGQAEASRINGTTGARYITFLSLIVLQLDYSYHFFLASLIYIKLTCENSSTNPATGVGSKKKGKDTTITPDQISAFPTKKTPVYKVKFTRMNLVMAGGCYLP
jgi:transcription initiation factor TFIID subunit 5